MFSPPSEIGEEPVVDEVGEADGVKTVQQDVVVNGVKSGGQVQENQKGGEPASAVISRSLVTLTSDVSVL